MSATDRLALHSCTLQLPPAVSWGRFSRDFESPGPDATSLHLRRLDAGPAIARRWKHASPAGEIAKSLRAHIGSPDHTVAGRSVG